MFEKISLIALLSLFSQSILYSEFENEYQGFVVPMK